MAVITVKYEIELPDDVNAVGGTLIAENTAWAIANVDHADGSVSAWICRNPTEDYNEWERAKSGFATMFYPSETSGNKAFAVVDNQWVQV